MDEIKFGSIRKYCSIIDRVSICRKETLCYENYESINLVPDKYNDKFLYGIGIIESEFDDTIKQCIEIMISDTPKKRNRNAKSIFVD